MPAPFEQLAGLDKLVHEPARLAILAALGACRSADFLYLQRLTGQVDKGFVGKIPRTLLSLTAAGQSALERHWRQLEALRQGVQEWPASAEPGRSS